MYPVVIETLHDRIGQNPEAKDRVSVAVWDAIFGLRVPFAFKPDTDEEPRPAIEKHEDKFWQAMFPPHITRRIAALRKTSNVTIAIDAGSTTLAVLLALLRAENIPFITHVEKEPDDDERTRFRIRPQLLTNSPMLSALVRSSAHAHSIPMRIIGGDLRVTRNSICGALADLCLASWRLRSDIAIIGTTGIRSDGSVISFGSDDILESRLKATLLESAGLLRVVVTDFSKFKRGNVAHEFAALDSRLIDVVAINVGTSPNSHANPPAIPRQINNLVTQAKEFGVGVLLVT